MIEYSNIEIMALIKDRIHSSRDRAILRNRLVHGHTFDQLSEEHHMSVRQIKRIVYKGQEAIFK